MRGAGCLLGWGGNGWKGVDGTATGFKSAWGSRRLGLVRSLLESFGRWCLACRGRPTL